MNKSIDHNPMQHFLKWFYEMDTAYPHKETNAMQLATIGLDGFPKSRVVLLKKFTWEGFVFFTNFESEKGNAILHNNNVSLLFNWVYGNKEVLISGKAEKIPKKIAEGYFESRPKGSKLGAWASKQSTVISSRNILDDQLTYYENKFKNNPIPIPKYWGGYLVKPHVMIFTQHHPTYKDREITSYSLQPDYCWDKELRFLK